MKEMTMIFNFVIFNLAQYDEEVVEFNWRKKING